ncbi:MAG: hypothetical protein ABIF12_02315 [bacterium]
MMRTRINNDSRDTDGLKVDGSKLTCIAWFKLADLISRKEKEKALSLYRLISHSFENKAYTLQVEGDILWSMEDKRALERYTQAAYLYKKEKNLIASIAVYEHLLTMEPQNFDYLKTLILFYLFLSWPEKFEENYLKAFFLLDQGFIDQNQLLDFTKSIIGFSVNTRKLNLHQFEQEYEVELKEPKEYFWITKTLTSILKRTNNSFYKIVKKYCLDRELNFDS